MERLKDKIVVITGSGSGCGRAAALLFAREGAKTIIGVDINTDTARETAEMVKRLGAQSYAIQADVSKNAEVVPMAEEIRRLVPHVNVLFNNVGKTVHHGLETTTEEIWYDMINTNLSSVFFCTKHLLPLLKAAGSATIVNHASIDSLHGNVQILGYSASKGGMIPLGHVLAGELAKFNIRVNSICSGGIQTGMTVKSETRKALLTSNTPLGRRGTPEEVAYVALFLACDESSYVDGAEIVVDGGRTGLTRGTPSVVEMT